MMTPRELLESTLWETFRDPVGRSGRVELDLPLDEEELEAFEGLQPARLPDDVRDLLGFARGFTLLGERVDFRGHLPSEFDVPFACGVPIYTDGYGNFWVVHVHPATGEWAPVLFTSHDPPVIVVQSGDLGDFLEEFFNLLRPGQISNLATIYRVALDVWSQDRGLCRAVELRNAAEPALRAFARTLRDDSYIADLRHWDPGIGFAWGKFGSATRVRRHGPDLLFALEKPGREGFPRRLFRG